MQGSKTMEHEEIVKAITEINTSVHEMRLQLDMRFDYIEQDIAATMDIVDELKGWRSGFLGVQRAAIYVIGIVLAVVGLIRFT